MKLRSSWWIWLITIIIISGIYRVCYVLFSPQPIVIYDATTYSALAKNFIEKSIYSIGGSSPSAFYTPGYPFFLVLIYSLFGMENFVAVRVAHAILSTLTLLLWSLLAWKITKKRWLTLGVASVGAIYAPFVWANGLVLTEILATFFLALWLVTLPNMWERCSLKKLLISGIIFGILLTIRPAPSLGLPFLVLWLLILKKENWMAILTNALIIGFGSLLILLPWWVRNYQAFKRFIPFSAESGNVFLIGTYYNYGYTPEQEKMWPQSTTEFGTDKLKIDFALDRISEEFKASPVKYLRWYLIDKAHLHWFQIYSSPNIGLISQSVTTFLHNSIGYGALLGIFWWFRRRKENMALGVVIGFLIYYQLIHQIFVTINRLSFPIMGAALMLSGWFFGEIKATIDAINKKMSWDSNKFTELIVSVIAAILFANNRLRQQSILQHMNPDLVQVAAVSRYLAILAALIFFFMRIFNVSLTNLKRRMWEFVVILVVSFGIAVSLPNSFMSAPECLIKKCAPEDQLISLAPGEAIIRVIDLPKWFDAQETTELFIFAKNARPEKGMLKVRYEGKELSIEVNSHTPAKYNKKLDIPNATNKIKFEIINSSNVDIEILVNRRKNFGLSAWENNYNDVSPDDGLQSGTFLIGLTQPSRKPFPVDLWYGSSTYLVRRDLLMSEQEVD